MIATLAILWTGKKIPEPFIVLAAAAAGLIAYPLLH
jgi:chromate transporter